LQAARAPYIVAREREWNEPAPMARIKCIMMQHDETQLLEPWLRYHGHLFGYENLVVLDHGSRAPEVLAVLDRYRAAGVTVEWLDPAPELFTQKGKLVTRAIRALDHAALVRGEAYDFAVPLDCDEFVAVMEPAEVSVERDAIHAAFDALVGEKQALAIEMSFTNAVGRPGGFTTGVAWKSFLPAGGVTELDEGFHRPHSSLADGVRETRLCHLHFRHKPFPVFLEHARRKLAARIDCSDPQALLAYVGPGHHLVPYLFMTAKQYARMSDDLVAFAAPGFVAAARRIGIDGMLFGETAVLPDGAFAVKLPGRRARGFDAAAYMRANPDVARAPHGPLYHYLRHGWQEGRPLG